MQLSEPGNILHVILSMFDFEAHICYSGQFIIDLIFTGPILSDNWLIYAALEKVSNNIWEEVIATLGPVGKTFGLGPERHYFRQGPPSLQPT